MTGQPAEHEPCDCPNCQHMASFNPLAWGTLHPNPDSELLAVHAIPGNDIHIHDLNDDARCACNPWVDEEAEDLLIVHNAFDGREDFIRNLRKPS